MATYPLHLQGGHLFVEVAGQRWLFDTGTAVSFGTTPSLTIAERAFALKPIMTGKPGKPIVGVPKLIPFLGTPCAGVLGMDVIGEFDWTLNAAKRTCTATAEAIPIRDRSFALRLENGQLSAQVGVRDREYRLRLDTGFQLTFLEHAVVENFPSAGKGRDFHVYFLGGWFQTDSFHVPMKLGAEFAADNLRTGRLPASLRKDILPEAFDGILGAEFLARHYLAFAPRRQLIAFLTSGE
jgi:hypothetical protein